MIRPPAMSAVRVDAGLAALAAAGVTAEALAKPLEGPLGLELIGLLTIGATLAFRHRAPLGALAAFWLAAIVQSALLTPLPSFSTLFLVAILMPYTVGAHVAGRPALAAPALTLMGVTAINVLGDTLLFGDFLFPIGAMLASWFAGRTVRQRTRLAAELHEQAVAARERREEAERQAVAEERRRIAREMHDVVAHSVSVMVVQAGGARRILDSEPERARAAAGEIERTGRQALGEMRRLLGVLRPEEPGVAAALAPNPSFDQVEALVARAREAGLPATLTVVGAPRPVPAGMDLAAYRIVQEALTNALKHAGRVPTEVRVTWTAERLELRIVNARPLPAGSRRPPATGGGHGLIGMRERVRLYGGELDAAVARGGGFAVRATLPLEPAATEAVAA